MPLPPIPTGWAPQQLLNGLQPGSQSGGYQIPPEALRYLSPEQIQQLTASMGGPQQQNPVDAFIASLPPEVQSNPTAILQAASSDPSMAQAVIEKFGIQDAGGMTFENPYRHPLSEALVQGAKDVLIPYGAAMGAIALTGAGAGGAAGAGAGGGSATTYPLAAAGGPITATPLTAGAGTAAVAGSTAAAGAIPAAAGAAGGFADKWLPYITGGANALLGAHAADKATDAETAAYGQAIDESRRQYDTTRNDLMPWLTAGQGALGQLQNPTANFMASPDYEFRRSEGQRDIGNSFAARGGAASGNALKALSEYNSALASGEFGDWWNRQAGLAGVGQTAGTQLGQLGANTSANVGSFLAGQGASRASGVLGKYGSLAQGLNQGVGNWLYRRAG